MGADTSLDFGPLDGRVEKIRCHFDSPPRLHQVADQLLRLEVGGDVAEERWQVRNLESRALEAALEPRERALVRRGQRRPGLGQSDPVFTRDERSLPKP